jgi:hypothetical protein
MVRLPPRRRAEKGMWTMITITTTTPAEAQGMAVLMRGAPPELGYQIYLLGHQVVLRAGGGQEILDVDAVPWPQDAEPGDGIGDSSRTEDRQDTAVGMPALAAPVAVPDPPENGRKDSRAAVYDVMFPVRRRVIAAFSGDEIEHAAQVAFWQHPPDDCTVPDQKLEFTWLDDLLAPGARMIRISGDVIPPDGLLPVAAGDEMVLRTDDAPAGSPDDG